MPANTAMRRLGALRRGGVLEGTFFEPSPRPLGLARGGFVFQHTKRRGAAAIAQVLDHFPSVSIAVIGHGVMLAHVWARPRELDDIAAGLGSALRASGTTECYNTDRMPPARGDDTRLSTVDRKLVLELRKDPDRTVGEIARSLGVTRRTIERRGSRLVAAGVGSMRPRFRPSKAEGRVLVNYFVARGDARAPTSMARAFPDALLSGGAHMFIDVANLAEAESRRAAAARLEGISDIEAYLVEDILFPRAFEGWLAGHVANAPTPGAR